MRRPSTWMLLAVILAVSAGALAFVYLRGAQVREADGQLGAPAFVTTGSLPVGTTLSQAQSQGLVVAEDMPANLIPQGAITSIDATNAELLAQSEIAAGQIVLAQAFDVSLPQITSLAIPAGRMAVSVQLEDPAKVGSFLRPGSEIAVFNTTEIPASGNGQAASHLTRLLLDRVQVLAIGPVSQQDSSSATSDSWSAQLVTLALTTHQAELVVHGVRTGSLYLALLNDSPVQADSVGVTDASVLTSAPSTH